jgi:hypothetical protein
MVLRPPSKLSQHIDGLGAQRYNMPDLASSI